MPFVQNDDVRVYYEVEGSGPPIVLQHGFSDSLESWRECGYVDALADTNRVILVDARGHGESDKPHDPEAYSLDRMVSDVTAVLDDLGVEKAHFFGHSMGGRIAYGMARYAPKRLLSLLVASIPPYNNPERSTNFVAFLEKGPHGFVEVWKQLAPISAALEARLRANDIQALIAAQKYRIHHSDDVLDALPALSCPWKLMCGELDTLAPYAEIVEYASRLPEGSLITLPGLNHLEAFQRSDVVLPHLRKLFAEAST
jgi:pimeloyl-ACP methyl ester carboxylesterase